MPVGLFMSQNVNLSTSSGGSTSTPSSSSCADSTVGRELLRKLALAPNKSTECLSKYFSQFGNDQLLLVDYETLKRPPRSPQLNNIFNNTTNSIMYESESYMNKIDNFEDCIHLNTNTTNTHSNNNNNNNNKSSFSISPNNSIDLSNTNEYMAAANLLLTPACSSSSSSSSSSCSSSSYSFGNQPADRIPSECQILLPPVERVRNNIDYAIDAVLAKCRSDSGDEAASDADHEFNVLDSSLSSSSLQAPPPPPPLSLPQQPTKSKPNKKARLDKPQLSPAPASDIVLSVAPVTVSSFNSTVSSPGQPMSKSSKARTSYISSLIANRERGAQKEDEVPPPPPPAPSGTVATTASEDEKQRRISQNILTILANNVQPNQPQTILPESHETHQQTDEIDFVINYQQQQQQQCQMEESYSYRAPGQPHQFEAGRLSNEHTSAYLECVNLKRLLAQPIETTNGVHAATATNAQLYDDMQQILTESAFDNVKITVKNVLTSTEFDASSQQSSGCVRAAAVVVPPVQADVVVASVEAKTESSESALKGPKRKRAVNKNTSAAKSRQQAQSKAVPSVVSSEPDKTISQVNILKQTLS